MIKIELDRIEVRELAYELYELGERQYEEGFHNAAWLNLNHATNLDPGLEEKTRPLIEAILNYAYDQQSIRDLNIKREL